MRIIHYIMGDPKIINENGLSVNSEIKKLPEDVSLHETKINFRIFDAKAYEALVQRISQASKDYGFIPNRSPTLKDGEILPQQYEPVPRHIFGKPIEDIDGITFDKTFCVISRRFSSNYVNRFSATRAFFIFTPWNPIRKAALFVSTNQYFDSFVILTIMVNCVFLALPYSVEQAEYVFLSIYTTEMVTKAIAKGFILNKYTYLRNAWNWLDFIVIVLGFVTIFVELGNLSGLRTFRVLRALKTVSILPGLKTIVNALLHSISMLTEVMALTVFCLMVFALFGLQIFMGVLRNKCVENLALTLNDTEYERFVANESNWYKDTDEEFQVCGNVTGAWLCPKNYTCLTDIGDNPNFGYSSFDNFGWAMLTTFQLITLDFWEDIYNKIISSCGPSSIVFFIFVVFFGSFYLINLMLAVVAMSYEEEVTNSKSETLNRIAGVQHQAGHFVKSPQKRNIIITRRGAITVKSKIDETDIQEEEHPKKRKSKKIKFKFAGSLLKSQKATTSSGNHVNKKILRNGFNKGPSSDHTLTNNVQKLPHFKDEKESLQPRNSSLAAEKEKNDRNNEANEWNAYDGINHTETNQNATINNILSGSAEFPVNPGLPHMANELPPEMINNKSSDGTMKMTSFSAPIIIQNVYPDHNCICCQDFCCHYRCWLKFQSILGLLVKDAFFELFITLCIVINTAFLAAEHHGMSADHRYVANIGNKVFTAIFTLEAFLKLLALSKDYFKNGWNIFDLIAVTGSLIDLSFENFNGLSVLRSLRLLRVFKLAQSWTTMKVLLSIILSTIGALGNLTLVLIIIMYIFAILGMQLFGNNYTPEKFYPEKVPRWNFSDFPHSFLMIFRVLCGEWIEPLFDCMRTSDNGGQACIGLFLPALVVGNFLVLNLFLALLLSSFNSEQLAKSGKKDDDNSSLAERLERIKHFLLPNCCLKRSTVTPSMTDESLSSSSSGSGGGEFAEQTNRQNDNGLEQDERTRHSTEQSKSSNEEDSVQSQAIAWEPVVTYVDKLVHGALSQSAPPPDNTTISHLDMENVPPSLPANVSYRNKASVSSSTLHDDFMNHSSSSSSSSGSTISSSPSRQTVKNATSVVEDPEEHEDKGLPLEDRWPEDCCPSFFYKIMFCKSTFLTTYMAHLWFLFRKSTLLVVDHPAFEWIILALILASSISLCFEDIYLENNRQLQVALCYLNLLFTVLFTLEMLLKWIAHGFVVYFTNIWTLLDFTIVIVSIVNLVIENSGNLNALRSMRTLRALRPLRAISKWQGMKIVVNALVSSIPSIVNVLLVCVVFWLVFSIMGVQFFAGKFYKCLDDSDHLLSVDEVNNKSECLLKNYSWVNSNVNFDNVGQGYLALFQIATFEGWMEIMADASDAREVDEQPEFESNMIAYLYFVIFIVCGSFFTLNLFIGVIIDNFNMLKKKYEGGVLDIFLTESQKNYYAAMKKLGRKKPQKLVHRPKNKFQIFFYNICMSRKFEMLVFIIILVNMISMGVEHYNQPPIVDYILEIANMIFASLFTVEALMKILAFRHFYFMVPWNVFDFLLVVSSILGILLKDMMDGFFISPTLLRVIRVFRIGRVLRLIKAAKGIRKLIFALMVSLPALFNIGALLFLIMFIYAIIGMSSFGYVKHEGVINDMINFETFGNSMMLLFRLITSAGWSDILGTLMIAPPDCDLHDKNLPNGNCGHPMLAVIYLVSYIIINYMIVINMYIAVILENFNQAHQEEETGIVEDDLEMFYVKWANFDPQATQFIPLNKVSDFLDSLDPPLRIPKPNTIALVSFDVPIARGYKIHCLDILRALIKNVLGHVEETEEFLKIQNQMEEKFKKQFPSRKRVTIISSTIQWKKEDLAAKIIQTAFRRWRKHKNQSHVSPHFPGRRRPSVSSTGAARFRKIANLLIIPGNFRASTPSTVKTVTSTTTEMQTPLSDGSGGLFPGMNSINDSSPNSHSSNNSFYVLPEG